MKKNACKFLSILVVLLALIVGFVPAGHAHAEEADLAQVWTDDFSSGKGSSYTPHGYWWNGSKLIVGGQSTQAGWSYYYLNDLQWTDFVMEFDVAGQTNAFGAVIRAGDPGPGADQGNGYAIMADLAYAYVGKLTGTWAQVQTPVESYACPLTTANTHWKIVAQGNEICIYFNGATTPSIRVVDDTFTAGQIGFRALNSDGAVTAVVDNLTVTELVNGEATDQVWTDDFASNKAESYTAYGLWQYNSQLTVGDPNAGAGVCYYWVNGQTWTDFVMEFDVLRQSREFGVILRAQNTTGNDCQNQGYGILYDTNWAFFMAENGSFTNFEGMSAAGNASAVEGVPVAAQPGTQNAHWKIVAKGNRIEVYFNHSETPSMAMDASLYTSGAIGFRTNNPGSAITAIVDNLTITELHTLSKVDEKAANCTEDGNTEHYACSTCDRKFANAEGTALAGNVAIPAAHTLEKQASNTPSCTGEGNMEYYHCTVCQKNYSDETATNELTDVSQDATGHSMVKTAASAPSCTQPGNIEYYTCSTCGKSFKDAEGAVEVTDTAVAATGHALTKTEAVAPTATQNGNIEYYTCSTCGKLYSDAAGTKEVTAEAVIVPPTGINADNLQVWEDDFSSGKGGSYIPHGYWWNLDGQLTVGDTAAGAGVCYYWLKDMVWDDFVMEFDVLQQSSEFGVIIRAQDTSANDCQNQGYGILYDTDWAFFMAENGSFTTFDQLVKDGKASKVDTYAWACQPGSTENVHWKLVAKGDTISVYFNNAATPSMVMKSDLWDSGAIGFRTNNPGGAVTAVVDNLTITQIADSNADTPSVPQNGDSAYPMILVLISLSTAALAVLLLNKRRFLF